MVCILTFFGLAAVLATFHKIGLFFSSLLVTLTVRVKKSFEFVDKATIIPITFHNLLIFYKFINFLGSTNQWPVL